MKFEKRNLNLFPDPSSPDSLAPLLSCMASSIATLRDILTIHNYLEVSTNSIGAQSFREEIELDETLYPDSCNNLLLSLFSDTNLKLDTLVMNLQQNCFHVRQRPLSSSTLSYASPVEQLLGQRTLIQLEAVYTTISTEALMDKLVYLGEHLTRFLAKELPQRNPLDLRSLEVPVSDLTDIQEQRFIKITYAQALQACLENSSSDAQIAATLFQTFGNLPVFVLYPPRERKQFFFASNPDANVAAAFDLYLPGSGAVLSGGILADSTEMLEDNLQLQIPGADPKGAAREKFSKYKTQIHKSAHRRGVLEVHVEGILNSLFRNTVLCKQGNRRDTSDSFSAMNLQRKKSTSKLHLPL